MEQLFSIMSNLQTYCHFKLDLQKLEQQVVIPRHHTPQNNELQSLELPYIMS